VFSLLKEIDLHVRESFLQFCDFFFALPYFPLNFVLRKIEKAKSRIEKMLKSHVLRMFVCSRQFVAASHRAHCQNPRSFADNILTARGTVSSGLWKDSTVIME
jgi:hypothetical protein